jgi:hypothetical protein
LQFFDEHGNIASSFAADGIDFENGDSVIQFKNAGSQQLNTQFNGSELQI